MRYLSMAAPRKPTQENCGMKSRQVGNPRNPENLATVSGYAAAGNPCGVALLAGASS